MHGDISNIFLRKKKDNSYRIIINLRNLNKVVEYHHFKMESLMSAIKLMVPNCYMASVDLRDAYYSVPLAEEHKKYVKFEWEGKIYQFTCLAMGLACSPRKFTKLLKPAYASLLKQGHIVVPYVDDIYIQGNSARQCWQSVKESVDLLQQLGFIINFKKSVFYPTQEITFLGFILNSVTMSVRLTDGKVDNVVQECKELLRNSGSKSPGHYGFMVLNMIPCFTED
jgi:hypothetical protein